MTAPSGLPRLLAGFDADGAAMTLGAHERTHGPLPALRPAELIDLVARSGLRGRGGADFPTARKLQTLVDARRVSAVVVNGSETEPASRKDRTLLQRAPHLVLDGAVLAAQAIGARAVIVKVGDGAPGAIAALESAISVRDSGEARYQPVTWTPGVRDRRGERRDRASQRWPVTADVHASAPVRAGLPRSSDADPQPGDARAVGADRTSRRALVSGARHLGGSGVRAGHDLRCRRAPRGLRAGIRHADGRR